MTQYKLMKYEDIKPYIPDMERLKVSEVARSNSGFLTYYKSNPMLNEQWAKKRNGFIARTLPAYEKNPTYRRFFSLIAWAFYPGPKPT